MRKGIYVGEIFVCFHHVLGEDVEVFVQGGKGKDKSRSKCFKRGKFGHVGRERFSCHEFSSKRNKPGHRVVECSFGVGFVSSLAPLHHS